MSISTASYADADAGAGANGNGKTDISYLSLNVPHAKINFSGGYHTGLKMTE